MTPLKILLILLILLITTLALAGKKEEAGDKIQATCRDIAVISLILMVPISIWCILYYIKV